MTNPSSPKMPEHIHSSILIDAMSAGATADKVILSKDIPGEDGQWHVELRTLHGGKQEGTQLIIVDTGHMQVTLIPTRGMGILNVIAGDVRLGWDSPVKEVVNPAYMNLESRNGLGWLEGFNEWMCRCGLEFSGHPGTDEFVNNIGARDSMMLTLHGKIANIPSSYAEVRVEKENGKTVIRVLGRVEERVFHGPKLSLETVVSIPVEGTSFRINDTVTNMGSQPQEYQMLYHCNFGSPLLEKGSRFIANVLTNEPFNDRAAKGLKTFDVYDAPEPGFIEQVYKMTLKADADKQTSVMLHNAAADRGASMSYSINDLPFFTLWKNTDATEDGYVTGLEPGTCFPHNRKIERAAGRVHLLAPMEKRSFGLDIALHLDSDQVAQKKASISQIS
jgi:hypothetical protein